MNWNYCLLFFGVFFMGCAGSDNTPMNPDESENPTEEPPVGEMTVSAINAFPNLNFVRPVDFQSPSDNTDRIFVVEQGGTIKVFPNVEETTDSNTFLDISNQLVSQNELGLLGLAFHPNYGDNGFFYVMYTPTRTMSVVARFQVNPSDANNAIANSETILLEIPQPFTNHNGGQIAFGPDGFLYIASGDGGSGGDPQGNAQNLTNLLGKVLRIDVDTNENGLNYAIPGDNPFIENTGARDEIYAYGLRNPWRFSFDSETGNIWLGDVGQNKIEEINVIDRGGNYGWNIQEGTSCFGSSNCDTDGLIAPVFEYDQSNNDRSVTGGYVYRGMNTPSLEGRYIYGDFISGRIWALTTNLNDDLENQLLVDLGFNVASFGTDIRNELYICGFDGAIYKLVEN